MLAPCLPVLLGCPVVWGCTPRTLCVCVCVPQLLQLRSIAPALAWSDSHYSCFNPYGSFNKSWAIAELGDPSQREETRSTLCAPPCSARCRGAEHMLLQLAYTACAHFILGGGAPSLGWSHGMSRGRDPSVPGVNGCLMLNHAMPCCPQSATSCSTHSSLPRVRLHAARMCMCRGP